jgi:peptide/nickel transport system substrate-binding protein
VIQLDASVLTTEPTPPRLAIFESLYSLDSGNIPQPALATSAEVSDDGLTWTFQLRPGVKFHNGQDFTSADVVASYERFLNVGRMAPLFVNNGQAEFVATGPLTVEARLTEPYGAFLEAVAAMSGSFVIFPADIASANVDNTDLALADHVGTGPYMVRDFIPDNRAELVRFDDYTQHDGEASYLAGPREAYFDEIIIRHIPDNGARVAALLSGEVDLIFPLPADDVARVSADPNVDFTVTTPGARIYIKFNPTKAPFNDPLVREAVRTAVDADELMIGFGDPQFTNVDFTPRYQEGQGLWVDQSHLYPNDLEAGRALLEQSSYGGETVTMLAGSDRVDFPMAVALQQLLQRLGMAVEMRVVDGATFGAVRRDVTAWDIKPSGGGSLVGVTYLDSSGIDRTNTPWPGIPDSWYEALDAVKNTSTIEERRAAASVVYDIHAEMNYEMWIGSVYLIAGHRSDLRNVPPMDTLPFWNIWRAS